MNLIQDYNSRVDELVPASDRASTHAFSHDGDIVLILQRKSRTPSRFVVFRFGSGETAEIMTDSLADASHELRYEIPVWIRDEINGTPPWTIPAREWAEPA